MSIIIFIYILIFAGGLLGRNEAVFNEALKPHLELMAAKLRCSGKNFERDEEVKEILESEISFILIAKVKAIRQMDVKDSFFSEFEIFNNKEVIY